MTQLDTLADFDHWEDDYYDYGMDYRPYGDEPDDSDVPEGLFFAGKRMDNDTFYDVTDSEDYRNWELEQEAELLRQIVRDEAEALATEEHAWAVEQGFAHRDAGVQRLGQFGARRLFVMQGDEDQSVEHKKLANAAAHKSRDKK